MTPRLLGRTRSLASAMAMAVTLVAAASLGPGGATADTGSAGSSSGSSSGSAMFGSSSGSSDLLPQGGVLGGVALSVGAGASATAIGPGIAVSTAGINRTATAVSVLGIAAASAPTLSLGGLNSGQVTCVGVFAYAHSSTAGDCVGVLGLLEGTHDKPGGTVSLALKNPFALLADGLSASDLMASLSSGESLLSKDISRLTLGGPDIVALTSDYGFKPVSKNGAAIELAWLGTEIGLFPTTKNTAGFLGDNSSVNYLGLPRIGSSNAGIIPEISVGDFVVPGLGTIPGWSTGSPGSGSVSGSGSADGGSSSGSADTGSIGRKTGSAASTDVVVPGGIGADALVKQVAGLPPRLP
ncbi:hypothetical protein [Gordonia aurantiaca]|uniref:hypothetical protein n=1 Tax=Gordonia sp. B21 TaxID=3151852 RepID=UPI0032654094